MKVVSNVDAKSNSDIEQIVTTPSTPVFVEEISFVKSMGTMSMLEPEFPVSKKLYACIRNDEIAKW